MGQYASNAFEIQSSTGYMLGIPHSKHWNLKYSISKHSRHKNLYMHRIIKILYKQLSGYKDMLSMRYKLILYISMGLIPEMSYKWCGKILLYSKIKLRPQI